MNGPKEILKDFKGYLQCDGYKVYDKIGSMNQDITLVGCLTYVRRYFHQAKDSDPTLSNDALKIFQKIYAIEKQIRENGTMSPNQIYKIRQKETKPLMEQLLKWIEEESIKVLPKSPIGKAMKYYQSQWQKLRMVTEDGRLQIDNNQIENKIRPLALRRKNYLFAGSHKGAERIAMMYSFFGSCKINDIYPRVWLTETLEQIGEHPVNRLDELMPGYSK